MKIMLRKRIQQKDDQSPWSEEKKRRKEERV